MQNFLINFFFDNFLCQSKEMKDMLIVESSTFMQKTFIFDNVLCLSKEIKDMLIVKLNCRVFHLCAKKTLSKVF